MSAQNVELGENAYARGDYKEALNRWYDALLLNRNDARLDDLIASAEAALRDKEVRENVTLAVELYGRGAYEDSIDVLGKTIAVQPGDARVQKLYTDVRGELSGDFLEKGKRLYAQRKYDAAVDSWRRAGYYGYDSGYVSQLITTAREQKRREEEELQRREEEERKRIAEEERRKALELEEEKKEKMRKELAAETGQTPGVPVKPAVTEENKRASNQHYKAGVIYFQNQQYDKARQEWTLAVQLNAEHPDAQAGLKRIDQLAASGQ